MSTKLRKETTVFIHRIRGLVGAALVVLAFGGAAAVPASAASHRHSRHVVTHRVHRTVNNGIPQHNGGDRDSDNNGAPSDGDGNF